MLYQVLIPVESIFINILKLLPMRTVCNISVLLLWLSSVLHAQQNIAAFPELTGQYLGQKVPGMTAEMFAPGVVSTGLEELNSVFYPDGNEFYFCVRNADLSTIFVIKREGKFWIKPKPLPFSGIYNDIDVTISPDGQKLFFCSNRPDSARVTGRNDYDIWFCNRTGDTWSKPIHLGEEINSDKDDFYPVVSKNGTLYFNSQRAGEGTNDIYMSKIVDGKYTKAEKSGPEINSEYREYDAFIDPDEKFIIFTSDRPGNSGRGDLYISFKNREGNWTTAKNMGTVINGMGPEFSPCVSPDGKYLFYTRQTWTPVTEIKEPLTYEYYLKVHNSPDNLSGNIWWIDARVINDLK
jgi:Tol biopolymer transport system component